MMLWYPQKKFVLKKMAKNLMHNHKITVKTKSGNVIDAKIDTLKQEGLFPAANIVNDLAEYNASNAPAAVSALAAPAVGMMPAASGKAAKGKVVVQGENVAEQQLQYWFQQADKRNPKLVFLKLGRKKQKIIVFLTAL